MRTTSAPLREAMYVANQLDTSWLQVEQRRLYERSRNNPAYVFCKLWGFVTDPRNLRVAAARVASNKGTRTAGVDGFTVRGALGQGVEAFVHDLRSELRAGVYRPSPVRRVLIPKSGQPGKFRPLGIPTVKDRVVQAAMKNILDPVFEADLYPVSYGFRPGKGVHGALEHLSTTAEDLRRLRETLPLVDDAWCRFHDGSKDSEGATGQGRAPPQGAP
jgi:RNA-directed DNA polymerase